MEWRKEMGPRAGEGGWKEDFPLDHELPDAIELDCSRLSPTIHPMFAIRLRVFVDWHAAQGRSVHVLPPYDPHARQLFKAMGIDGVSTTQEDNAVLPVTKISEFLEVEEVAEKTQNILEYELPDVSPLGPATFMAVSELCGNAIEHGANSLGSYVAVRRIQTPRRQISVAIADLGIGIPEHLRQHYPEWIDDGWAIAHATEERITGTGNGHRGIGFSAVLEAALTQSLHGAQLNILSARGFCRVHQVQEQRKVEVFPTPQFRRGTWITYDLVSV